MNTERGRPLEPLLPLADDSPVTARANWRWMLGTFLTGIAGAGLIGGALLAAFDGHARFAVTPTRDQLNGRITTASLGPAGPAARKSDKLSTVSGGVSLRQIIHETKVTKIGAKEFISVKPYARVVTSLAQAGSDLTGDLPAFNPLKLFADAASNADRPAPRNLSSGSINVAAAPLAPEPGLLAPEEEQISNDEAASLVREALEISGAIARYEAAPQVPSDPDPSGDVMLASVGGAAVQLGAGDGDGDGNLTEIEPSGRLAAGEVMADRSVMVERGDSLAGILRTNGATPQEAKAIADAVDPVFPVRKLKEGIQLRLAFAPDLSDGRMQPARLSMFEEDDHLVTVGLSSAEPLVYGALDAGQALIEGEETARVAGYESRLQIYRSLYETGRRNNVADTIVNKLIRIHAYDVDFKRQTQSGDTLEVFYAADDNEGNVSGEPEILYTALTIRGETKRFYRFRTPDDGEVDYYDEDGKSAKKFLIRKPMQGGVLRSGFGMRRHPILRYRKMHTGVDWSASRGTPIVAAGNGVVEKAEWTSGYGRYTLIRHANGYKTAYSHQSAFARGVVAGAKVRQGQVIGYVGSTGLSTGPHLHYEVIVNGRFVDPMRIRVPRGRTLQARLLKAFEREKIRIDRLMRQEPAVSRVAEARLVPTR